ncbi:hypothetical protein [Desulfurococcus amylolyticus]|nr:hypothetical protein [Desulfurococcus amylolyticus]
MKAFIHHVAWWTPEGAYHRALKADVEVVEWDVRVAIFLLNIFIWLK